jgi:hypothetical protein
MAVLHSRRVDINGDCTTNHFHVQHRRREQSLLVAIALLLKLYHEEESGGKL